MSRANTVRLNATVDTSYLQSGISNNRHPSEIYGFTARLKFCRFAIWHVARHVATGYPGLGISHLSTLSLECVPPLGHYLHITHRQ